MKTLFLMVGISGSGKSVFSEKLSETLKIPRHSSDEIRAELCGGDMADQSKNGQVFKMLHSRVEQDLNTGSVIADATSVKAADRKVFRQIALRQGAQVIAVVMNTSKEDAHVYNASRDRTVPDFVIEKQFAAYSVPTLEEVSEVWYVDWQQGVTSVQKPNQFAMGYETNILTYAEQVSKI